MATTASNGSQTPESVEGIAKITVGGYKSISREQSIDVRPLTLLAGANSSGKSSIMQPLLLMKQTLESSYEPNALLLNGPNVQFTSLEQVLPKRILVRPQSLSIGLEIKQNAFFIGFENKHHATLTTFFTVGKGSGFEVDYLNRQDEDGLSVYRQGMKNEHLTADAPKMLMDVLALFHFGDDTLIEWQVVRDRCFLQIDLKIKRPDGSVLAQLEIKPSHDIEPKILEIIHLPGLRGHPARVYPATAVGPSFPGTFDSYAASVIADWQILDRQELLALLQQHLRSLGLTSTLDAKFISDTQVELRVGRTLASDANDMVSIADVGIGVSQTLPVLVALLAAKPGQLVYLEQPEIHLHPRAQVAMAHILADAAKRGVRVVAETHSSLLLLGVQTLVAEGKLPPELVKLHWFTRDEDGVTTIQSADLDEGGTFGDWPEDFGDISLEAQSRYLDAAETHLVGK